MPDHFALLNELRRPWLEPEALKQKFLEASAQVHPDRVHSLGEAQRAAAQQRYVELNAAYQCLREPRERLRHLLELERGAVPKDIQRIPPELMDFFLRIGQACREADALIVEKSKTVSPLLQVKLFERTEEARESLQDLQRKVTARREELVAELKRLDANWPAAGGPAAPGIPDRLEELYRLFSYFDRWLSQLQERLAQLSF